MDSRRSRQLLLWPLVPVVGASLVALPVGGTLLAVLSANNTSNNPWEGLGNFILSLLVGFCVAVISWVAGLVWVARWLFPRGNRASVGVLSVVAVVVTATAVRLTIGVLDNTGAPGGLSALGLLGLVVLGVPSLVFRLWGRRVDPARGGPPWLDGRAGPGPMSSDEVVRGPGPFHGETEWRPEE